MSRLRLSVLSLAAAAVLSACGSPDVAPQRGSTAGGDTSQAGNFRGRTYERNFVFTTLSGDSAFMVPWLMSAHTRPGGVDRRARGWLARGATWDAFYDQAWSTPPTRSPWRILPHGSLRLIVGEGDAIEGILFSEGARQLELELSGGPLIEWTGTQDQVYRLLDAAVYLSDQKVDGLALDMTRVRNADRQEGDWAFLVSGDSLQVVLENPEGAPPGTVGAYRGWARLDFRDLQWADLTVDWAEVRAFQPSRQDVPVSWAVTSEDGNVQGTLQVQSAQIQPGRGDGPVLPVDAIFLVEGTLEIEGGAFPVHGIFRHTRP